MKIGTLNLCLGLKSKKEDVKELILGNQIDILCLQEVEVETGYDSALLEFRGYNFEVEKNTLKSRSAIYIRNGISYNRRIDLEGTNSHIVIIDVLAETKIRIIKYIR